LKKYHTKQHSNSAEKTLVVYRGLGLPNDEFEKLKKGYLISFSEFLSTSRKRELAEIYVQQGVDDIQSILFEIELDYTIQTSSPFADISEQSQFNLEEEILLSMGSVFRIQSLNRISENIWNIRLSQTSDEDQQLKQLYQWLNAAIFKVNHLHTKLSSLMLFVYDYEKAEYFLKKTMAQPGYSQDIRTLGATSSIFGEICFHQNNYEKAEMLYQTTIELFEKNPEKNEPSTVQRCYTGLSEIYLEKAQYMRATRYNNIEYIYCKLENTEQALHYIQKALDYTRSLPSNIPLISRIFCNLTVTYEQSENYSKSEFYWKKGLEHHLQSMPNNTDATASLFQAVAITLADHQKYAESIEYLKRSLTICKNQEQILLFSCYKHLATAYNGLKEFQTADKYLQKAIEIAHTLSSIDLSPIYVDSGNNHYQAQNYQQALLSYGKALEFSQLHNNLSTHLKIFIVYTIQNESTHALNYYEHNIRSRLAEMTVNDQ
ncbi:unnamed protein product, partial [Rotaria sp. Silwood1]